MMQVETYEIEEVNDSEASTMAADGEAAMLIDKLGLEGQKKLLCKETGTRFPYPRMTAVQNMVYSTCFPQRVDLAEFASEIIPIRVLQVAAFCKDFPQTPYLEVWHSRLIKEDPILVGRKGRYDGEIYLLARWGNALLDFETLTSKAKEILRVEYQKKVNRLKSKIHEMDANLENLVESAVTTGEETSFSVYI